MSGRIWNWCGDGKVPDVYALQVKAKLGAPAVTRGVIGGVAECGCGGVAYDPDGRRCGRLVYRNAAGLLFGIGSGAAVSAGSFVDEEPPATTVAAEAGTADRAVVTAQMHPRSRAFMRVFFMSQISPKLEI